MSERQHPGQPGHGAQNADVAEMGDAKASQCPGERAEQAGGSREAELAGQQVQAKAAQNIVQYDGGVEREFDGQQRVEQPVGRVERAHFALGEQWIARAERAGPPGELARAQGRL